MYAFAKPANFDFSREEGTKVGGTASGVTSLRSKLVNSRAPEMYDLTIYARIYVCVLLLQRRKQLTHVQSVLVLHELAYLQPDLFGQW